jgi:hypothetical protein
LITNSILDYSKRGPYGDASFRGNSNGYILEDLIDWFGAKSVFDPMEGSGTHKEVCAAKGVHYVGKDLSQGWDALEGELPSDRFDLIIIHPPYWGMLKFSQDARDLSNAATLQDFLAQLSAIMNRLASLLTKQGRMIIYVGNWRKDGRYYPLGALLESLFLNELKDELIKIQRNTRSKHWLYGHKFIPIMHEKVLIFGGFKSITWEGLLLRSLKNLGGKATLAQLYDQLKAHPKSADNPTFEATIRRTLQQGDGFKRLGPGAWGIPGGRSA